MEGPKGVGKTSTALRHARTVQTVDDDDVRHLRWLRDRLGERLLDSVVVTTGPAAYRRPDDVAVVPLALLGP